MAILNFNSTPTNAPNSTGNKQRMPFGGLSNPSDRPKSKLWLNIGYDKNGKFINLPLGMPIDTMEAAEVRGQNEDFIKQRTAQNELLKALQQLGSSFEPGQEQVINLTIKLRRVNEEIDVSKTENEYSVDLGSLLLAAAE